MSNERFKFDQARLQDFELIVEVGDTLSPEGLTYVALSGNGSLVVEQRREKETGKKYESRIDVETTASLLRKASEFDWERPFPSRPGLPDEAIVQWILRNRNGAAARVKVWLREAEKNPVMAPVLEGLRKNVDRMTDGHLYL